LTVPSGRSGGYCQARGRIGLEFLGAVHERILGTLAGSVRASDLWRGHVVKAIDGTSFQLLDTLPNQRDYPQPGGQKTGCGFPV
jgi:hypothetical protein